MRVELVATDVSYTIPKEVLKVTLEGRPDLVEDIATLIKGIIKKSISLEVR